MARLSKNEICSYCAVSFADEEDHIVARQFFPPETRFRGGLPKVPACGSCNRSKQRVEDGMAVLFQFGHASEASIRVLNGRVGRTLRKNKRLFLSLKNGLSRVLIQHDSGLFVPGLGIHLQDRELNDAHEWFSMLTRGLYRLETGQVLPRDNSVFLIMPKTHMQADTLILIIRQDPGHKHRSLADGEFQYVFTIGQGDPVSAWFYSFMSISVFAITLAPNCPEELKQQFQAVAWKPSTVGN